MARLVLADDNVTTQRVFELSLAGEGHQLECFSTAEDTLQHLRENGADLLFVHAGIPEQGGYELSREVKSSRDTSGLTVVMLVGAFQPFDAAKAARCGCLHQLAKPFETSTLLDTIRSLLENPPGIVLPEARHLFRIPLEEYQTQTVFDLSIEQCAVSGGLHERDVTAAPAPDFESLARGLPPGFGEEQHGDEASSSPAAG